MWYTYGAEGTFDWDDIDYWEFKVAASWSPITNWTLSGAFYWTPDQDIASPENISVEGGIAYTLPRGLDLHPDGRRPSWFLRC